MFAGLNLVDLWMSIFQTARIAEQGHDLLYVLSFLHLSQALGTR